MKKHPRIPLPAKANLVGTERVIQVNHCRTPDCENYGLPARHRYGKAGRSPDRDLAYMLQDVTRDRVATFKCKACGDVPPL